MTADQSDRTHPAGPDHAGEESMGIGPPPPGGDEGDEAFGGAEAMKGLLTGEEAHPAQDPNQQAGQDPTLRQRLRDNPEDADAKIDVGSDESMDASDTPSTSAPGSDRPMPSSGFIE